MQFMIKRDKKQVCKGVVYTRVLCWQWCDPAAPLKDTNKMLIQ